MHKIFPHTKSGVTEVAPTVPDAAAEMQRESGRSCGGTEQLSPPPLPRGYVIQERCRRVINRFLYQVYKTSLKLELLFRRSADSASHVVIACGATILSSVLVGILLSLGDVGSTKASETSLAAAQIIGAALALVLSLSIIPAQRASELFAFPVLALFANDRSLRLAFALLVLTTLLSLLLGSNWIGALEAKPALSVQFVLIGISFDALRMFYVATLSLLAPEAAIKRLLGKMQGQIVSVGRLADKVVGLQIVAGQKSDAVEKQLHALAVEGSHLPKTLRYWASQFEESAHRFISRRDSNATIAVLDALEVMAREYAELRRKSINLHVDPQFLFAGPQSDVSEVLNVVYESTLRIVEDAIASKNERVVQRCMEGLASMAAHAMSVIVTRKGDIAVAPLAFGGVFIFKERRAWWLPRTCRMRSFRQSLDCRTFCLACHTRLI